MLVVDTHPLLDLAAFITEFPQPLGDMALSMELRQSAAPFQSDDAVRETIRRLLRHGGFKPTGRSKPASEYLIKAAAENKLSPINSAVDICNLASLHSGLPISVVDADFLKSPLKVAVAPAGACYVFNASGQVIDVAGLLCLFDADGPCANGVKDAQRTKTHPLTRRTLTLIWGSRELPGRTELVEAWYRQLLQTLGATTAPVPQTDGS